MKQARADAAAERAAHVALLRLVAVWLGCGLVRLGALGVAWIWALSEPPTFEAVPRWITLGALTVQGLALAWAVHRPSRSGSPLALVLLGVAGIGGSAIAAWGYRELTLRVSERGLETLGAFSAAMLEASTVELGGTYVLGLAALGYLAVRATRREPAERGAYRAPDDGLDDAGA